MSRKSPSQSKNLNDTHDNVTIMTRHSSNSSLGKESALTLGQRNVLSGRRCFALTINEKDCKIACISLCCKQFFTFREKRQKRFEMRNGRVVPLKRQRKFRQCFSPKSEKAPDGGGQKTKRSLTYLSYPLLHMPHAMRQRAAENIILSPPTNGRQSI